MLQPEVSPPTATSQVSPGAVSWQGLWCGTGRRWETAFCPSLGTDCICSMTTFEEDDPLLPVLSFQAVQLLTLSPLHMPPPPLM